MVKKENRTMKRTKMYMFFIYFICCVYLGGGSVYAQSETHNIYIQPDNVHQEITYGIWKLPDSWESIFLNRETDAEGQKQYDQTLKELDQQSQKELDASYTLINASFKSDEKGNLSCTLEKGVYYVRQMDATDTLQVVSVLFISPLSQTSNVIHPKVMVSSDVSHPSTPNSKQEASSKGASTSTNLDQKTWLMTGIVALGIVVWIIWKRKGSRR